MKLKSLQTSLFTMHFKDGNFVYISSDRIFEDYIKILFEMKDYREISSCSFVAATVDFCNNRYAISISKKHQFQQKHGETGIKVEITDSFVKSVECLEETKELSSMATFSLADSTIMKSDKNLLLYSNRNHLEYTDMAVSIYRDYVELLKEGKVRKNEDMERSVKVIRRFIREYNQAPINFGYFSLKFDGFDLFIKHNKNVDRIPKNKTNFIMPTAEEIKQIRARKEYFARPEQWNGEQWNKVCLYDFIIANQIEQAIRQEGRKTKVDASPLILIDAFDDMDNADAKPYLNTLRALDRQVFIIQKHENAYVRKYCDQSFEV